MKLSNLEKRELDKFTKFLALKCTQIIVQSRLGEKVSTNCRSETKGTDWFNLNISDLPDVLAETKKVLNGEILSSNLPLCIEISLRTVEGDRMVLENWCLSMLPEQCDPTTRIVHTIYNRMGTLLKSLVSITRVVPAYKLSRRQGPDSFVICYRIFLGEPLIQCLGEDFNQVHIGQICTPIGTLSLSVSYRTKLTISPTHSGRHNSIMLKSDHFNAKSTSKGKGKKKGEKKEPPMNRPLFIPFADDPSKKWLPHPSLYSPDMSPGFTRRYFPHIKLEGYPEEYNPYEDYYVSSDDSEESEGESEETKTELKKSDDEKQEANGNSTTDNLTTKLDSMKVDDDDFVMVELNAPFASDSELGELAKFYRMFKSAPPLERKEEEPLSKEDIDKMLKKFEAQQKEFDAFFKKYLGEASTSTSTK